MKLISIRPAVQPVPALAFAVILGLSGMALQAQAATATASLAVTARVNGACTIATTAPVGFGIYDTALVGPTLAVGTLSVSCPTTQSGTISLSAGANEGVGSTQANPTRRMASGTNFLAYQLFTDSDRAIVWADGALNTVTHVGTGNLATLSVYGSLAGQQTAVTGNYADTVTATITY